MKLYVKLKHIKCKDIKLSQRLNEISSISGLKCFRAEEYGNHRALYSVASGPSYANDKYGSSYIWKDNSGKIHCFLGTLGTRVCLGIFINEMRKDERLEFCENITDIIKEIKLFNNI